MYVQPEHLRDEPLATKNACLALLQHTNDHHQHTYTKLTDA